MRKRKRDKQSEQPKPKRKLAPGEFENTALKLRFTLPEPFLYEHFEAWEYARQSALIEGAKIAETINWIGATAIIQEWECEYMPILGNYEKWGKLKKGKGNELPVIFWVGAQVRLHVMAAMAIPKK